MRVTKLSRASLLNHHVSQMLVPKLRRLMRRNTRNNASSITFKIPMSPYPPMPFFMGQEPLYGPLGAPMDNNQRQIPCQTYLSAYKALISDSAAGAGQDVRLARALILGSPLVVGHSWSVVNCLGRDPKKELQGQRQ